GLPKNLGNGLLLRWATPKDAEALAAFNLRIHSDDPAEPEMFLRHWTHDLMRGDHPTTKADDFTIVVDTNNDNNIVSSMNLISQTWLFEDIPFKVGRPELVGTDEAYRRKGLIRAQFEAIHAKSAARGETVQAITGIPWYYRLFDYEMALDLGGGRIFNWHRRGNFKPVNPEPYTLREAASGDIPQLQALYEEHGRFSLITRVRDETLWQYEMFGGHPDSPYARHVYMIEEAGTDYVVGYVEYRKWGNRFQVRELGVTPGQSWRPICVFITRALKAEADEPSGRKPPKVEYIFFDLGVHHPVYEALGKQLDQQVQPYAWYMRVPDLAGFLRHIAPVLERRLASSVLVGHTGDLKMNFYRTQLKLGFENGRLQTIEPFTPKALDGGDVRFPELTFLQLLFGRRSFEEMDKAFADCYASDAETAVLLNILFPKQHSKVVGLG
ncbi:MAG: GNAT family N-acetyltransferase, partial [Anaerolineales bacterium]|nr:GNAT family N-acetyltransferase [Anaerolineales bacterium]